MNTPLFLLLFGLLSQRGGGGAGGFSPNTPQSATSSLACESDLRWVNNDQKFARLSNTIQVILFSAVGAGCTPSEVRVTAVYLDFNENVVCSGVVENVAVLDQNTHSTILEFKPLTTLEFVRWINGLHPPQPIAKRLICFGPDQLTEVTRADTDRAASMRLFINLLPRSGGISTVEIRIDPYH